MKKIALLAVGTFLSMGSFLFGQETSDFENVEAEETVALSTFDTDTNSNTSLELASTLQLTEDQKKQLTEIQQQYNTLRSELASEGEERTQIEDQLKTLEKRQIATILNEEQLIVFNEIWDSEKQTTQEFIQ